MTPASLVLDLVERVWNGGDLDALADVLRADRSSTTAAPAPSTSCVAWHREDAATWAGTSYVVARLRRPDDAVALRWRATSTHVGPWGPVPTTGRRVEWVGAHFFRVEGGRIVAMHARCRPVRQGDAARRPHDTARAPLNDEGAG